jgi:zinc transport system ATP-binding protein
MAPEASLQFIIDGRVLYASSGKWLHPLFELERYLRGREIDVRKGEIHDKVVGRGSAFLIVRLGVKRVHAVLLSRLGKDVLDHAGVACTWDSLVDEIQCRTEGLLRSVTSAEEAYGILSELAQEPRAS